MRKWILMIPILLLTVCGAAWTQETEPEAKPEMKTEEKSEIALSIGYGAFLPTNSDTKDTFGSTWGRFSIDIFRPNPPEKWTPLIDLGLLSRDNNDSSVRLFALNGGVIRGFGGTESLQPYVILRAGPYYGSVDVDSLGVDENKIGLNANAAIGLMFNKRYYVEARYDYFSKIGGFNFDGLTLSGGIKVYTFK